MLKDVARLGDKKGKDPMEQLEKVFAEQVAKLDELKGGITDELDLQKLKDELNDEL